MLVKAYPKVPGLGMLIPLEEIFRKVKTSQ
jgi:hypothetical protein